jgi:phytoene desaturase
MNSQPYDTIIIGSGLGGLSAALILAHSGQRVLILEKNATTGGKLGQVITDGFTFDTGPSLLTMPFVLEDLFAQVGEELSSHLTIQRLDTICRYFFHDGTTIDASSSLDKFRGQVSLFSPDDAVNLESYFNYSKKIYEAAAPLFLFSPFREISALLSKVALKGLGKLPSIDAFRTVHAAHEHFFVSPHLRQLFDRYATYSGSDPYQAPATLNIIPHVEYSLGSYYIGGGMYRLAQCLENLIRQRNGFFQFNSTVKKIRYTGGRIRGVLLESGESLECRNIIANSDAVWTFENLIDGFPHKTELMTQLEPSCSGLVFLWGINAQHSRLCHHNIFFSCDYRSEFVDIFERKIPPEDPTIYVSITSKSDPTHSPAGSENWFVLLNMPALHSGHPAWTSDLITSIRRQVLDRLALSGFEDLEEKITSETVITPETFLQRFYTNRGSIYGVSSNSRYAAFLRQPNRSRELKGLYFAGGSAHPGGGIPLVLLSGKHAATLLLQRDKSGRSLWPDLKRKRSP